MHLSVKSVLAENPKSWVFGGFLLENEVAIDFPDASASRQSLSKAPNRGSFKSGGARFDAAALLGNFDLPGSMKTSRPASDTAEADAERVAAPALPGFSDMVFRLPGVVASDREEFGTTATGIDGRRGLLAQLGYDAEWADPCAYLKKMFERKGSDCPIKKHLRLWGQQRDRQATEAVENEAFQTEAVSSVQSATLARGRFMNTIEKKKFDNLSNYKNYMKRLNDEIRHDQNARNARAVVHLARIAR